MGSGRHVWVNSLSGVTVRAPDHFLRMHPSENCLNQGSTEGVEGPAPGAQWHPPSTCSTGQGLTPSPCKRQRPALQTRRGSAGSLRGGACAERAQTSPSPLEASLSPKLLTLSPQFDFPHPVLTWETPKGHGGPSSSRRPV